jgi:hypothetical protein
MRRFRNNFDDNYNEPLLNIRPCPGLSLGTSREFNWYVPEGFTPIERTICGTCCSAHQIEGALTQLGPSNCDSFYYLNRADNGIFNYSVWHENKKTLFPGSSDGTVNIANGLFYVLLSGYGLKPKQYYTWEIYKNDTNLVESSPENVYYKSTALTSGYYFVNAEELRPQPLIFRPGDKLTVKIHIYNLTPLDPFSAQGDLGVATIHAALNTVITEKHGKIAPSYNGTQIGLPIHTYLNRFTTSPLSYDLQFYCTDTDTIRLRETQTLILRKRQEELYLLVKKSSAQLAAWKVELQRLQRLVEHESELLASYEEEDSYLSAVSLHH